MILGQYIIQQKKLSWQTWQAINCSFGINKVFRAKKKKKKSKAKELTVYFVILHKNEQQASFFF